MPDLPFLTIVFPCYNEKDRLPETLRKVEGWLDAKGFAAEILVVDDGSTDGTAESARSSVRDAGRLRVLENPGNRGKGYSVRHGLREARGEWSLFSDADLSTPIEDFDVLYAKVEAGGHDVVIGSRALPDSNIVLYQPFHRVFMGQTFNRIVRWITGLPFTDTQCGFKLMNTAKIQPVVRTMVVDKFAIDVELVYLAVRRGLSVADAPVTWRDSPQSKVGLVGDPLNMLLDTWRVVRRYERGEYAT